MQKWEYCALVGIAKNGRNPSPYMPAVWYFTDRGIMMTEIEGDEVHGVGKFIAQLGNEGWEMVGGMSVFERAPARVAFGLMVTEDAALFFKRPKEQTQEK
jgi:hypothetical protein